MLLRLAYLAATNAFALLRLLPMSDREKDIEILALRHQLLVLQRQVGKPAFTNTDRAILVGLAGADKSSAQVGGLRASSRDVPSKQDLNAFKFGAT